jgi:hypothetical protein
MLEAFPGANACTRLWDQPRFSRTGPLPQALDCTASAARLGNPLALRRNPAPAEPTALRESAFSGTEAAPTRAGAASDSAAQRRRSQAIGNTSQRSRRGAARPSPRRAYFTRAAVSVPQALPTTTPVGASTETATVLVKPSPSASSVMVRST